MDNMGIPKTIVFRTGEETKPVIMNSEGLEESLIKDQVNQALKCIQSMAQECSVKNNNGEWEDSPFTDVYHNNIVSYIGERGSGKTSCMYTVANLLQNSNVCNCHCLDAIDPSFFDEHHNVIQIVIGKMYGNFRKSIEGFYAQKKKEHEIADLRKCFYETKKHLKYLDKEPEYSEDNEIEALYQLSSGIDLKESMANLVREFLKLFDQEVLLITIDDIDQNFSRAYEMAEQLRKYLIIPGVIIQLAAKLEQLSDVIQIKMALQYKNLPNKKEHDYADMADRYLTKLLPLESRIYMPSMDVFFETPLKIVVDEQDKDIEIGDLKTTVTQLIFQKCRYLFYNTKGTTSYIVPRNLRELRMLLGLLIKMPDYRSFGVNNKVTLSENNKEVFKNYLFGDWLNKLGEESKNVAKELIGEKEPVRFNKKVIQLLAELYEYKYMSEKEPSYISDISNRNNATYNVSLGDVFTYIDYLSKMESQKDGHLLLFFIKTLYSIRLYEYYDMITDELDNLDKKEINSKPYRKDEILENVSYLQKFVGGSYYYISGESVIPVIGGGVKDNQREVRLIDGATLNALIRDIVARYSHMEKATIAEKKIFTEDLHIAEFFMLTVSRFIYSKGGGKEFGNYRTSTDAYYDRDLSKVTNMEFNAMSPFFNLLDIKHTYGRFSPLIFDIAKTWNDEENIHVASLYNQLLKECHDRTNYSEEHDLLSKSTIRNAEIAEDLFAYLERQSNRLRPENGEIGILADFYRNVFMYQIATYDREKESNGKTLPHIIRFVPFKVLAEFLMNCRDQQKFYNIYNKVFSKRITPYKYIEKSMYKEDIWKLLKDMYPTINDNKHKDDFLYHFRSDKRYGRTATIPKLESLSRAWGMKLDGTSTTNE